MHLLNEEEVKEFLDKLDNHHNDELDLYQRMINIIDSCVINEQCDSTRKMIQQISTTNQNLASALLYPLGIKRRTINSMKPELQNEEI